MKRCGGKNPSKIPCKKKYNNSVLAIFRNCTSEKHLESRDFQVVNKGFRKTDEVNVHWPLMYYDDVKEAETIAFAVALFW